MSSIGPYLELYRLIKKYRPEASEEEIYELGLDCLKTGVMRETHIDGTDCPVCNKTDCLVKDDEEDFLICLNCGTRFF